MNSRSISCLRISHLFKNKLSRTSASTRVCFQLCRQPVWETHRKLVSYTSLHTSKLINLSSTNRLYCSGNPGEEKVRKENILTIPNFLTVSRMAMCPYLGYLVIHQDYTPAFGLFVIAGITDLV